MLMTSDTCVKVAAYTHKMIPDIYESKSCMRELALVLQSPLGSSKRDVHIARDGLSIYIVYCRRLHLPDCERSVNILHCDGKAV